MRHPKIVNGSHKMSCDHSVVMTTDFMRPTNFMRPTIPGMTCDPHVTMSATYNWLSLKNMRPTILYYFLEVSRNNWILHRF